MCVRIIWTTIAFNIHDLKFQQFPIIAITAIYRIFPSHTISHHIQKYSLHYIMYKSNRNTAYGLVYIMPVSEDRPPFNKSPYRTHLGSIHTERLRLWLSFCVKYINETHHNLQLQTISVDKPLE